MTLSIMMMMVMILLGCWKTKLQQMRLFAVVLFVLVKKAVEELWRFSGSPPGVLWGPSLTLSGSLSSQVPQPLLLVVLSSQLGNLTSPCGVLTVDMAIMVKTQQQRPHTRS